MNKTGTSKVGAIFKAQKAQDFFLKKKLEIFEFFSFRKCRILRKGDSFETLKNFGKKVAQCRKKIERGPFSLVRFCRLR